MTFIKICCISSQAEARLAIKAGANALGLVSAMPSGPGIIGEDLIADIAATVPPSVDTFLLTSQVDPERIIAQQRQTGVSTLQICDYVAPEAYALLRNELPNIQLVQVIHVTGPDAVERAQAAASHVDAILLDTGSFGPVKELGGTGRTHDWAISRRIRDTVGRPVYLAGGLNAANVADALRLVEPFAVDVCSGVRTAGLLDSQKLETFVREVRRIRRN
jgi:phosphoribosylanthranilate isomerase